MTIHVSIGEAQARLSELVAAALRGEEVVLQKTGEPKVRLVAIPEAVALERTTRAAKRAAAIGFAREKYKDFPPEAFDVPPSMTNEDYDERIERKLGARPA
ncbi:MAG: type II toxin-antitoxin system Phd/YefM family antitoxin [Reyranella sp.]